MESLKTILVALVVAASLFVAAGTAWAHSDSGQRGTAWTEAEAPTLSGGPSGVTWEVFGVGFDF
jgi:hypothetical protein